MKISFDFDCTLSRKILQDYARELRWRGFTIYITTTRSGDGIPPYGDSSRNKDLYEVAKDLNIPNSHITFTSGEYKAEFLRDKDFLIHFDDDYRDLEVINQTTDVAGISVWKTTSWKRKAETVIRKNKDKQVIEKLKLHNEEMLKELIILYKWQQRTEHDISLVWMTNVGKTIEKVTDKKINKLMEDLDGKNNWNN